MAIADDFSIAINGDIRYTGTTANYTVLEFHRWLQDLADDEVAAVAGDLMSITEITPSDKSTANILTLINGYNITATEAIHLYDGSVAQADGDTTYAGLVVVGVVEAGTNVIIVQDNALLTDTWSAFPNADPANSILLRMMVLVRLDGADIDGRKIITEAREFGDSYGEFSVTMGLGNNTAALFTAVDGNNQTAQATVNAWAITNTEGFQFLDVSAAGSQEEFYSQWDLGIQGINDLYEFGKDIQRRTTSETIHGMNGSLFRGITHQIQYDGESGTGPATNDEIAWGLQITYDTLVNTFAVGDAVSIGGDSFGRILSLDTLQMLVSIEVDNSPISTDAIVQLTSPADATANVDGAPVGQATGGGMGTILAVEDTGLAGTVWLQLAKGTAPVDPAIMYEVSAHANTMDVNGAVVVRTVSSPFIGVSTGSAINPGAYGLGIDPDDLTSNDLLVDLGNNPVQPPNNVTFDVSGLEIGEDRVLVGPEAGGILELDQDTLNGALTSGVQVAIVMTTAIPTDTPASGTIRVQLDTGSYRRQVYTSYTGSTYTIPSSDYSGANQAADLNNVFISYIDLLATATTESFTAVYDVDRALFIRVRDGDTTPIKTFETTGTLGSAGGSAVASRISDE